MELSYRGLTFELGTLSYEPDHGKENSPCEPDYRKVAVRRWLRELSMNAECFCRTRLRSTGREGHLEEYTFLCDQTNEELNLHQIGDVALNKE